LTIATNSVLPSFALAVPLFFLLWGAARVLQGGAYEQHLDKGGEPASGGATFGIGLLGLVLFLVFWMGGVALYQSAWQASLGEKETFGPGEEVYYAGRVTKAEARQVGQRLQAAGFFDGRGAKTVLLTREDGRIIVSFVVLKHAVGNPEVLQFFQEFCRELSQQVFGGSPVVVRLCDEHLQVHKTLP
jgi:hypothetical protein